MGESVLPEVYRKSPAVVANYSYMDIAAGTGIIKFYGGKVGSGATYALSNNTFYSSQVMTEALGAGAAATDAKYQDLSFNVVINMPRTINGDAVVNVPFGLQGLGNSTYAIYIKAILYNGTTAISSQLSSSILSGSITDNVFAYGMACIILPVTNKNFKIGQTLKLALELWAQGSAPTNLEFFLGHDPMNRATSAYEYQLAGNDRLTFGTEPSNLTVQIPFKLDI